MGTRVAVLGAGGRMGSTICAAVAADDDLDLVGAVDSRADLDPVEGVPMARGVDALADLSVDVAVDFTVAEAARDNVLWCAGHGIHAVVGTTGLTDDDLARFRAAFTSSNCLVAPNFAIGAVLMMRFAELAAPYFDSAEVIELHHDAKPDAPSGTALATVRRMAAASGRWAPDPTRAEVVAGARGGVADAGIHVHSVRLRGLVAHQEVLLGTSGQTLTLRHDSLDRSSFVPGVLLACKRVAEHPGLTVGLEAYLGLT